MSPRVMAMPAAAFDCHFELVPKDAADAAPARAWSIDDEPIGETSWHDSSWMLRKGLDVIEELDPAPLQRHFGRAVADITEIDLGTLALVERE